MGRPATKKVNLRDGFYIEISPKLGGNSIKIRRETEEEILQVMKTYQRSKNVKYLGEVVKGKFLEELKAKKK